MQSASAQHSPAPGSNVEGDILLGPHDGGVVGEGVHQTREDDVLAPPGHAVGLGVDGGPPDEHQLGRQRGDQLVPVREHVAEVGLLRGLAGHQGEVLGDCLQYSTCVQYMSCVQTEEVVSHLQSPDLIPGPQVDRLGVGLGHAVEGDVVSAPGDNQPIRREYRQY